MPQTANQPDLFWAAIDWAIRGAGALLLVVLTLGWKDYRKKLELLANLDKRLAILEDRLRVGTGGRGQQDE